MEIIKTHKTRERLVDLTEKRLFGGKTITNGNGKEIPNVYYNVFTDNEIKRIRKFYEYLTAFDVNVGISRRATLINRLYSLRKIWDKTELDFVSEDNIAGLLMKLNNTNLKPSTKKGYRHAIRKYLCWREYGNDTKTKLQIEGFPKIVRLIPATNHKHDNKKIDVKEVFTREELRKIINGANSVADKAFFSMLIETGARIGELLNIKVKDVAYSDSPPLFIVDLNGKTGHRQNSIEIYFRYLNDWLNAHPLKDLANFKEQPLFVRKNRQKKWVAYNYDNTCFRLKTLRDRIGLTKAINPHNFRHTFVTHKQQEGWTDADIGLWVGWSKASTMIASYSHTTTKNVIEKKSARFGSTKKVYESENITCLNCKHINGKECSTCWNCKQSLAQVSPVEFKTSEEKVNTLIRQLLIEYGKNKGWKDTEFGNLLQTLGATN